jgi:hypothetical protein
MFLPEQIQARLREAPFRPFRLVISEGRRFDIDHSELVLVERRDRMIGTPDSAHPTIYDRVTRVALVHVVAMDDLPAVPRA